MDQLRSGLNSEVAAGIAASTSCTVRIVMTVTNGVPSPMHQRYTGRAEVLATLLSTINCQAHISSPQSGSVDSCGNIAQASVTLSWPSAGVGEGGGDAGSKAGDPTPLPTFVSAFDSNDRLPHP